VTPARGRIDNNVAEAGLVGGGICKDQGIPPNNALKPIFRPQGSNRDRIEAKTPCVAVIQQNGTV